LLRFQVSGVRCQVSATEFEPLCQNRSRKNSLPPLLANNCNPTGAIYSAVRIQYLLTPETIDHYSTFPFPTISFTSWAGTRPIFQHPGRHRPRLPKMWDESAYWRPAHPWYIPAAWPARLHRSTRWHADRQYAPRR